MLLETVSPYMAKKVSPPPSPAPHEYPSGTVRFSGRMLEKLRLIAFHSIGADGKRPKISELAEANLEGWVNQRMRELGLSLPGEK